MSTKNRGGRPRISEHKCPACEFKTKKTTDLESHYLNNHATIEEKKERYKFYCKDCNFGNQYEAKYTQHLQTKKHAIRIAGKSN